MQGWKGMLQKVAGSLCKARWDFLLNSELDRFERFKFTNFLKEKRA
jgi:hypothetical protein